MEDIDLGMRLSALGSRIELDPGVQGTHLKRWTFGHMLWTDFFGRGVPWVELLWRAQRAPAELNLSWRHRLSAAAALRLAVSAARGRPAEVASSLAGLGALNRSFYMLLLRRGGPPEAAAGIALHTVHLLTAAAAVPAGVIVQMTGRRAEPPAPQPRLGPPPDLSVATLAEGARRTAARFDRRRRRAGRASPARPGGPVGVAVLGAGPEGLAAGHLVALRGRPGTVFEPEGEVGGIARTNEYRGYRFDLGGHRFRAELDEVGRPVGGAPGRGAAAPPAALAHLQQRALPRAPGRERHARPAARRAPDRRRARGHRRALPLPAPGRRPDVGRVPHAAGERGRAHPPQRALHRRPPLRAPRGGDRPVARRPAGAPRGRRRALHPPGRPARLAPAPAPPRRGAGRGPAAAPPRLLPGRAGHHGGRALPRQLDLPARPGHAGGAGAQRGRLEREHGGARHGLPRRGVRVRAGRRAVGDAHRGGGRDGHVGARGHRADRSRPRGGRDQGRRARARTPSTTRCSARRWRRSSPTCSASRTS